MDLRPARQAADVQPRGHRGGIYPFMRGALCVFVRDLIVSGVLTDMMRGATCCLRDLFKLRRGGSPLGSERTDTTEALRKLDDHFAEIERACRYAPRPYEIVVLSDHGQTQGATFKQRNGYGLDELVERSLSQGDVAGIAGGDEQNSMVCASPSVRWRPARSRSRPKNDVSDRDAVVLGSGNLGLVYLMEERRRLTLEEIEERHPKLLPALREHPHVGWLLVRSSKDGAVALGARGVHYLAEGRDRGRGSARAILAYGTPPPSAHRRLPTRRRHHGRQLLRPGARRRLRLRGADLLPRRHRRATDPAIHPSPGTSRSTPGADHRRGERSRRSCGLAAALQTNADDEVEKALEPAAAGVAGPVGNARSGTARGLSAYAHRMTEAALSSTAPGPAARRRHVLDSGCQSHQLAVARANPACLGRVPCLWACTNFVQRHMISHGLSCSNAAWLSG